VSEQGEDGEGRSAIGRERVRVAVGWAHAPPVCCTAHTASLLAQLVRAEAARGVQPCVRMYQGTSHRPVTGPILTVLAADRTFRAPCSGEAGTKKSSVGRLSGDRTIDRTVPCALRPAPCALHPAPCALRPAPCALRPASCALPARSPTESQCVAMYR
jgi:hypothetical protein